MPDTDFAIPDFLRAIGKGPNERPEWWRKCWHAPNGGIPIDDLPESVECETWEPVLCPFYTIVTGDWTPEKDALLLGAGLEWMRANNKRRAEVYTAVHKMNGDGKSTTVASVAMWLIEVCDRPGERLARGIWAALKGGGQ
jgi:hypothetical protein